MRTFVIRACLLDPDPFGAALDGVLVWENIERKTMMARNITEAQKAPKCQILFTASSESARAKQILSLLGKNSILTVSDIANFSLIGGVIQFVIQDKKVRFEANLSAAYKAGLSFSSQLLKVASAVKNDSPAENANP